MTIYTFSTENGGGILRIKSDTEISMPLGFNRVVEETTDSDVTHAFTVGSKIKEDASGGFYYEWYEISNYSRDVDKSAAVSRRAEDTRDAVSAVFATVAESGGVEDGKIADHADLLKPWEAPKHYKVGNLCGYDGMAFRVRQEHDSQSVYPPTIVPALYKRIRKDGEGTHDNPIEYDATIGMELENGLFYKEGDVLYECIRDSGQPIYNRLADLVNIYVVVSNGGTE